VLRSEVYEPAVAKTEASRRSDRWAATGGGQGNAWAVVSAALAVLGLAAAGMIIAGTSGAQPLDSLPDGAASGLYGSVPGFGLLALLAGLAGRNRPRRAWLAWAGAIAGSLLLVSAAVVAVILLNAFMTLG
jgi:peptidoglycan/LPS O-acetylase OafA/YrhL